MGDPKGIGPEIIIKSIRKLDSSITDRIRIYGDPSVFEKAYKLVGSDTIRLNFASTSDSINHPQKMSEMEAAKTTFTALNRAISDANSDQLGAIVTAPVNKSRLNLVCPNFRGHTEYLASESGIQDPTMIFISVGKEKEIPVLSLVTTHAPIADLPKMITRKTVLSTILKTFEMMKEYTGRSNIRIAVAALNPHAGENGFLGREEIETIQPAIMDGQGRGVNCEGPFPADSLFNQSNFAKYDAIVAMYHDQGLIPLKASGMGNTVNFTAGLPFIRTSPAHGTAEDIAWSGSADESSMLSAIKVTDKCLSRKGRI
ncbi:MAG: 4-hydroxythreonine-4-phosphate dehydrogenase PdxA [Deltaproteobacteria bacterium]|nr:4-hydroxythreonine-4-phosphate dehydrogenase PdxA [Deltaproteobacteria bacterium]